MRKREEQVEQVEKDQSAQRESLETREGKVAQDEDFYQKRLLKTNENLRVKEDKMKEESATKEKLFRDNCSKDFVRKVKLQEERFTKKHDEVNTRIRELEQEKKRSNSRLQPAVDARARVEQDLASLTQDMTEMQ